MPVTSCQEDGKPGFRWGEEGKCYTYNPNDQSSEDAAYEKARRQGAAIESQDDE